MVSQTLIDLILEELSSPALDEEVRLARAAYFEFIPDLCEDDPSHEALTHCFLHWLVLDRPLGDGRGTPLQVYLAERTLAPEARRELAALAASIHGLFEVVKVEEPGAVLRDLLSLEVVRVTERRQLAGLGRGDVLEARLIPVGDKLVFASGAYLLHPPRARQHLKRLATKAREEGRPDRFGLIQRLQALTFRFRDRYRERVPMERVYADDAMAAPAPGPSAPEPPAGAQSSGPGRGTPPPAP
jgi:hypothetical protein